MSDNLQLVHLTLSYALQPEKYTSLILQAIGVQPEVGKISPRQFIALMGPYHNHGMVLRNKEGNREWLQDVDIKSMDTGAHFLTIYMVKDYICRARAICKCLHTVRIVRETAECDSIDIEFD